MVAVNDLGVKRLWGLLMMLCFWDCRQFPVIYRLSSHIFTCCQHTVAACQGWLGSALDQAPPNQSSIKCPKRGPEYAADPLNIPLFAPS